MIAGGSGNGGNGGVNNGSSGQLPTIMEGNGLKTNATNVKILSLSEKALNAPVVRNVLQSLSNVPQKFTSDDVETGENEESNVRKNKFQRRNSEASIKRNLL